MIYQVYVKSPSDRVVHDKRFEAEDFGDLSNKVLDFFRFEFEIVRVEKIEVLENYLPIRFGTNFNVVGA